MTTEDKIVKMFNECEGLISERGKTHGPIDSTYRTIAKLWSIRVGTIIKPSDVCDMLEDMKWVRSKAKPDYHDNSVDGINYKAFAYALREGGM